MDIVLEVILIVLAFVAGLLVGRKNPSIASAAAKVAADGQAAAKSFNKQSWLDAAEVFDSWRVVPRIITFSYGFWAGRITDWIALWYLRLPANERTVNVTAFVSVVLPGVFGLAVWVVKIYIDGGRIWTPTQAMSTSTTTSTQTTAVPAP